MCQVITAKATVDLTPLDKGQVECEATLHSGTLEHPEVISIIVDGLNADNLNVLMKGDLKVATLFGNPNVTGRTADGIDFETELAFIKGVEFGSDSASVHCYLDSYSEFTPEQDGKYCCWKFRLANLRFAGGGDAFTHLPPPSDTVPQEKKDEFHALVAEYRKQFKQPEMSPEQIKEKYKDFTLKGEARRNRLAFTFAGRQWHLDDDLHGRWPKSLSKIAQAVVSGTLSTEWVEGDSEDTLKAIATDIAELLTFALGRDVKWVSYGCFFEDGHSHKIVYRKPGLLAFNQSGFAVIDNWEPGNLRSFLETSGETFVASRDWWSTTIGLLSQARGSRNLEVKCSLLNTLLDRISSKIMGDNYGNEIDPNLNERIDRKWYRGVLHLVLRLLSRNWERRRTDSICGVIKGWNAEPSFPDKIIRSCNTLGIPEPSKKKLGFRHKLIHAGEMDKKLKTTDQKIDYLFGIESDACLLAIRMLEFGGFVFLRAYGTVHVKVGKLLSAE